MTILEFSYIVYSIFKNKSPVQYRMGLEGLYFSCFTTWSVPVYVGNGVQFSVPLPAQLALFPT